MSYRNVVCRLLQATKYPEVTIIANPNSKHKTTMWKTKIFFGTCWSSNCPALACPCRLLRSNKHLKNKYIAPQMTNKNIYATILQPIKCNIKLSCNAPISYFLYKKVQKMFCQFQLINICNYVVKIKWIFDLTNWKN